MEFLPVSSSGHLAILQNLFGIEGDSVVMFTIMLHIGTLFSVFYMYWKDIKELLVELVLLIRDIFTGRGLKINERPVRKLGIMIIVASIPTAVIGMLLKDVFESFYNSLVPIGIGLIITGALLWAAETKKSGQKEINGMKYSDAILIGVLQGVAIWPGISRSGSTLVGGLFANLDRDFAVEFAFLISIPAILGSLIFETSGGAMSSLEGSVGPVIVGGVLAALSGIFAIKTMIKVVRKYSLKYFTVYVWIVGLIVLAGSIFKA